ncbi:uncharacterized protein LOC100573976 [Acyrthosiphon pisum]|uniref:THAP-type domain-containing protein n=1 Tax=Acyrthosiphon pisum TaxID=7029 RepID=A0A8R2D4X6_ACYPI|nr:uncharacterized protein LOC100573976 [Acyrthosiphon pisum]|eukprot:XP_016661737.1 PREDICTED: uncharacterized protein LOC100573976 [Acyrthosiphon pisum]
MTDTDSSDVSSTSDVNYSDIDFDTPNTTDLKLSDNSDEPCDERPINNVSFERNSNRALRTYDQDSLSSPSENELDTVSLSSYVTSHGKTYQYDKCAVVLCNANARNQFDRLFFINFPRDNRSLSEIWWKLCGHNGMLNPMSKICSIHFKPDDFTPHMERRDGKLYKQTVLKNSYIVPTLYLKPYEYTKFTRKRKKRANDARKLPKKLTSVYVCVIQGCKKTSLKNAKDTLFFKFPLENKFLLKKWLTIIGLPYWKPLPTNRICSDHFESYYITKISNVFQLHKFAVPSIRPKNLFNHEDYNSKQPKTPVNDHIKPCDFNKLEFNIIDKNTLLVKEKKIKKSNDGRTILLNSLEDQIDQQLKKYGKILETTTLANATVINNSVKEKPLLNSSTKCNKTNVENILNDVNDIKEFQSKEKNTQILQSLNSSTKCNKTNVEEILNDVNDIKEFQSEEKTTQTLQLLNSSTKCNELNVDNILNDVNDIKEFQSKEKTTLSLTKQYLESFEKEIAKEREDINGNINNNDMDLDYVYLDILNDVNMNASVMEVQPTCDTNNSLKDEHNTAVLEFETNKNELKNMSVESIKTNLLFDDKEAMNKISNNNDLDLEYVYLGMLNDENMIGVQPLYDSNINVKVDECNTTEIGFEINKINSKNIIEESKNIEVSKKHKIVEVETPKSIIYDQNLTECYGEMLPPYCDPNCQLKCYYSVPGPQRRQIFNQFHMLQNVTEQNCKITELVQLIMVENVESDFERCLTFHLVMNKESVKVCRMFFMNTLGISEHRLDAVLKPASYSWYSNSDTVLKANQPKQAKVICEQITITDFMKESLKLLDKDYNLYEPESDTEVSLENVSSEEQEKVLMYIKSIPKVLCIPNFPGDLRKQMFETSICVAYMYKTYSENYIRNKIPPPYTKRQFKKIYNQYMKSHLKMV